MTLGEVLFLLLCLILGSISVAMLIVDRDNVSKKEAVFFVLVLVLCVGSVGYILINYIN